MSVREGAFARRRIPDEERFKRCRVHVRKMLSDRGVRAEAIEELDVGEGAVALVAEWPERATRVAAFLAPGTWHYYGRRPALEAFLRRLSEGGAPRSAEATTATKGDEEEEDVGVRIETVLTCRLTPEETAALRSRCERALGVAFASIEIESWCHDDFLSDKLAEKDALLKPRVLNEAEKRDLCAKLGLAEPDGKLRLDRMPSVAPSSAEARYFAMRPGDVLTGISTLTNVIHCCYYACLPSLIGSTAEGADEAEEDEEGEATAEVD